MYKGLEHLQGVQDLSLRNMYLSGAQATAVLQNVQALQYYMTTPFDSAQCPLPSLQRCETMTITWQVLRSWSNKVWTMCGVCISL